MLQDLKDSKSYYTLAFDESTNAAGNKQMDVHIQYWSDKPEFPYPVKILFFRTFIIGHATADIMKDHLLQCISDDGLSLKYLLMLSSDGPKVIKILNDMDRYLKEIQLASLVRIGTCNLHIVHIVESFSWIL